jgi:ferrous iron transport protein B
MTYPTIALLGNPNCGKTTLFNALTGANQRVGNWPGVTVDRKEGHYRHGDSTMTVVDLPGIYAIDADDDGNLDETIARDYLLSGAAQVVVNILDASNLERNLYLTTQILEMGLPLVVALNMLDVAEEQGTRVNPTRLSERLGCPVVPMVAAKGRGVDELRQCLDEFLVAPHLPRAKVAYPSVLEAALTALTPAISTTATPTPQDRWVALKLLEYDDSNVPDLSNELLRQVAEQRHRIHQVLGEDIDIAVADSRYGYAHRLVTEVATRPREVALTQSDKIDQIVLNRWLDGLRRGLDHRAGLLECRDVLPGNDLLPPSVYLGSVGSGPDSRCHRHDDCPAMHSPCQTPPQDVAGKLRYFRKTSVASEPTVRHLDQPTHPGLLSPRLCLLTTQVAP